MIVIYNNGGLGNTIINLLSCFRLSKKYKTCINLNNNFNNLFTIKNLYVEDNIKIKCNLCNLLVFENEIDNKYIILKQLEKKGKNNVLTITHEDKYDDLNNIADKLNNLYGIFLKNIILNKNLETKVNEFSKKFDDNTISVHIRSWNSTHWDKSNKKGNPEKAKNRHKNQFQFEKFINEMKKHPDNNFFVASDNFFYIQELIKIFGDKIIYFNLKENLSQSQIDFIDILLLSKNKILIGTYNSTFTKSAWIFSNFKSKLYVI